MPNASRWTRVIESANHGIREVGILLVAFAPLEFGLAGKEVANKGGAFITFFVVGVALFVTSLVVDWRISDADQL